MEKLKVSLELFNALNYAKEYYKNEESEVVNEFILKHTFFGTWSCENQILHNLKLRELKKLLYSGYEL